jgi:hypothetical protein
MSKEKVMVTEAGASSSPAEVAVEHPPEITPAQEEIAKLAYSLWQARGSNGGSPEDDWFRAEQELKTNTQTAK